uniref:uncharacterized protein LOC120326675 n=1 Tax=Styela clava TaxID=7725 RepID=UPI001939B69D|nr:uncharacterized protein LOC120326675 [Styela clava]
MARKEIAGGRLQIGAVKEESLKRLCNRKRQNNRPSDPGTIEEPLQQQHIPKDFLVDDAIVNGARHIIFSTRKQLSLLSKSNAGIWMGRSTWLKTHFINFFLSMHSSGAANARNKFRNKYIYVFVLLPLLLF